MMEDPEIVRSRPAWAVSFSVGTVFLGCLVAAAVFFGLLWVMVSGVPPEDLRAAGIEWSPQQVAMSMGGFAALGFIAIGPTVAFGVGWLLRNVRSTQLHVIAFAVTGALVGAIAGFFVGGPAIANLLAAPVGVAAALGRLAVTPFARI